MIKPEVCKKCPAYKAPGPVGPSTHSNPKLVICGEAPGQTEIDIGKGFVGASGGLLWRLLSPVIDRKDCWVTNVAKCLTKDAGAFAYCWKTFTKHEFELPELQNVPILSLGAEAQKVLAPSTSSKGIIAARGTKVGKVVLALHPAFVRRTLKVDQDKQDLSPTITYDCQAALEDIPLPPRLYHHGISPLPEDVPFVSSDIETKRTLEPWKGPVWQMGFGYGSGLAMREEYQEAHRYKYQEVFDRYNVVFHNAAFDIPYLEYYGYKIPNWEDTMLAAHLLHPDFPLGLDFQNSLYVHYAPWKHLEKYEGHNYHGTDLDVTWQAWDKMRKELVSEGLWSLYEDELKPVTRVCMDLKSKGIRIDQERMLKVAMVLKNQSNKALEGLIKVAKIDWNSSTQIASLLYDKWHLPVKARTPKGAPSVAEDALEKLEHPVVHLLLAYRSLEKMIGTYCNYDLDPQGMYHPDIAFTNTTGRGKGFVMVIKRGAMRSFFVGDEPDWDVIYPDWNRVEMWVAAVLAGDEVMQDVLANTNFHQYIGSQAFGREIPKKSKEYVAAKQVVYGVGYGRSAKSVADMHDVPMADAQRVIDYMNQNFRLWHNWRKARIQEAYSKGFLENVFGFRRYIWSGNIPGMALSFDPQSIVAHMIKRCMTQLHYALPKPARIMFPLHDALPITCPPDMTDKVIKLVTECMTQPWKELGGWRAQLEVGVGKNLADASGD